MGGDGEDVGCEPTGLGGGVGDARRRRVVPPTDPANAPSAGRVVDAGAGTGRRRRVVEPDEEPVDDTVPGEAGPRRWRLWGGGATDPPVLPELPETLDLSVDDTAPAGKPAPATPAEPVPAARGGSGRRRHSAGRYGGGLRAGRGLLVTLLRERRGPLTRVLCWSVVEGVPALLSGALLAAAIDRGFLVGRPAVGFALLGVLALAMLVRAGATYAMFPHLAAVVEPIRDTLVRRVVSAAVLEATSGRPGAAHDADAAVARLTEQVESCRNLTASLLRTLRQLGVTIVAALVGLALLAPRLLPLVVLPLVVAVWLFVRLLPPLARRRRALVLADEEIAQRTARMVAGLTDVVACGAQERAVAFVGGAVDAQAAAAKLLARAASLRLLVVALGGQLPLLAVLVAAPMMVGHGGLSAGEIAGAALYLAQHLEPAVRAATATVGGWFLELLVVAGRLAQAGAAAAPAGVPEQSAPSPRGDGGRLVLDRVTFAYGPYAEPVVRDLSVSIAPGSHVAVVGPSGIGKSTLAALMSGLLAPDQGAVRLSGTPVGRWPQDALRRAIAVVPQEAYVFAGSVRENLAYLDPDVSGSDLDRAVRLVGAAELVTRLGGPEALIEDPRALSAGERQLVALARTYLSPARFVILDEATCHLDPATEALAEAAFATRAGALVVIAHRVDSARRADRIILMDGNRPRSGTHHELLASSVLYRDLVGAWEHRPASAPR